MPSPKLSARLLPLALAALALGTAACSTSRLPHHPRPPLASVQAEVASRFALPDAPIVESQLASGVHDGVRRRQLVLTCGDYQARVEIVEPEDSARRPMVLCLPILAGRNRVASLLSEHFAGIGYRAAWVDRQGSTLQVRQTLTGMESLMRRTVIHNRMFLAWARGRDDVDPDRMAVFGTSLGGMVGCAVLAAEPELAAGILAITGGDLPDLLLRSSERRVRRWRQHALQHEGLPATEIRMRGPTLLPSDPLALASAVDPRQVLVFGTRFDEAVRPRNQDLLWEALGRPERHLLPAGHYGVAVFLPWILGRADRFLASHFEG